MIRSFYFFFTILCKAVMNILISVFGGHAHSFLLIIHLWKELLIGNMFGRSYSTIFSSLQFSCSVMSNSLQPHESQHTRPPCPSPSPGVHSNSCPSSQWCHPAISSSIVAFSSCPQSLPALECFPMSQLFTWGGQSTGVSALASFLPKNTQGWSPLEWTARRSNQSILNEISPEYSLKGLMLKLKLQYFGHLMQRADLLEKTLMLGKIEGRRRRRR